MVGFVCYIISPGLLFALYGIPRLLIEFFFQPTLSPNGGRSKLYIFAKKKVLLAFFCKQLEDHFHWCQTASNLLKHINWR